jgi:hypothetical protein
LTLDKIKQGPGADVRGERESARGSGGQALAPGAWVEEKKLPVGRGRSAQCGF